MRTRRKSADASLATAVLTLVAAALLTITTGFWVMLQQEQFGPSVGDIIVFKPDPNPTERWSVHAAAADPTIPGFLATLTPRHCVLSPSVMAINGGSLVIEARRMSRPPVFRVYWSGGHTDAASSDCGTTADLELERTELMRLANVAGGFTSGLRLIGP
jgi:hypothetical protein